MGCPSVFAKSYWQPPDESRCRAKAREWKDCPIPVIIENLLFPVYGSQLRVSRCESSTSLIIRPDPFFGIFRQRAARQAFVFEDRGEYGGGLTLVGSLDVRCPSASEKEKFLSSPRWKEALWCAAGYLRPPSFMTAERGYSIPLLDFYSTHSGLLPFPCTPYVSHHRFFGYVCGQAAAYLCSEMMLKFGSAAHSPATINHIVATLRAGDDRDPVRRGVVAVCDEHASEGSGKPTGPAPADAEKGFYNKPMYHDEFEDLFDSSDLMTRGLRIELGIRSDRAAAMKLHIKAMLNSAIPIVAVVEFATLAQHLGSPPPVETPRGHVVTLIGYAEGWNPREFRTIFHDGHLGPYRELKVSNLEEAALATVDDDGRGENAIVMYSPLPQEVSPSGYRELFGEVYDAMSRLHATCDIRLLPVGMLRHHLLGYAPGQATRIRFEKLENLVERSERAFLWVVEYRRAGRICLDLVDTRDLIACRLGVLSCGSEPRRDSWELILPEGNARRITVDPFVKGVMDGSRREEIKPRTGE